MVKTIKQHKFGLLYESPRKNKVFSLIVGYTLYNSNDEGSILFRLLSNYLFLL